MNIIFTAESTGKALYATRRILDRYATRIGNGTWEAALTHEGLQTVKALLNRASSRAMTVVCHRITKDGARVVEWIIGNKRAFTHDGRCSTGRTAAKYPQDDSTQPFPVRLVARIVSLAGLLHDIGKATTAFQKVLWKQTALERVRHEAVSTMMLAWLAHHPTDADWIAAFIDAIDRQDIGALFHTSLNAALDKHHIADSASNYVFPGCGKTDCEKAPVLYGLLWLILAHHKLPHGTPQPVLNGATIDALKHTRIDGTVRPDTFVADGLPWNHDAWRNRLRDDLVALSALLADTEFAATGTNLLDHLRLLGRPALQLSDHAISSDTRSDPSPVCTYAYANTFQAPGRPIGQQLHAHLIAVSRHAARAVSELLSFRSALPGIEADGVPPSVRKATKDSRFAWQDAAAKAIRGHRTGVHTGAFFGVMAAGTGTGKTLGALKIASAFKQPLRVLYASPLRSLTLQSGSEYERLSFSPDEMATIIGDPLIRRLYDEARKQTEAGNFKPSDTDTANQDDDETDDNAALGIVGGAPPHDILDRFRFMRCLNERTVRMITTPVVAATLDTVMKLADGRRGSYLSHMLRIAASDLIIDEVDLYSSVDLLAIGRLIEAAGFWRCRVILSSATIAPAIASAFYRAFEKGAIARDRLENIDTPRFGGWFSDTVQPRIHRVPDAAAFDAAHTQFAAQASANAACHTGRRIAGYLKLASSDKDGISELLGAIRHLHQTNHIQTPDDRHFSFGCIQVVNVKHCQQIALELAQRHAAHPTFEFRVICLHGRLSLASRNWLENQLNPMLSRKGDDGDRAPLRNAFVRDFVSSSTATDLAIILVSTMETTGRDHDFDWGIIESRQERDIIQFAGRIRRHRYPKPADENKNLILWDIPLRRRPVTDTKNGAKKTPPTFAFQYFGVGDEISSVLESVAFRRPLHSPEHSAEHGNTPNYRQML